MGIQIILKKMKKKHFFQIFYHNVILFRITNKHKIRTLFLPKIFYSQYISINNSPLVVKDGEES